MLTCCSHPSACWGRGGLEAQLWGCFIWPRLTEVTVKALVGTAQPQLTSLTLLSFHLDPPNTPLPPQSPRSGRRNHLLEGQFAAKSPVLNKAEPLKLCSCPAASPEAQQRSRAVTLAPGKGLRHTTLERQQKEQETTAEAVTGSCSPSWPQRRDTGTPWQQCHSSVPCPLTPTAAHPSPGRLYLFIASSRDVADVI